MKKIFFVIPTFNRKDCVKNVLEDIEKQEKGDYEISTIMVVDGSNDGTSEMIKADFPKVHCVFGKGNWWYTRSMNEGFQLANKLEALFIL